MQTDRAIKWKKLPYIRHIDGIRDIRGKNEKKSVEVI